MLTFLEYVVRCDEDFGSGFQFTVTPGRKVVPDTSSITTASPLYKELEFAARWALSQHYDYHGGDVASGVNITMGPKPGFLEIVVTGPNGNMIAKYLNRRGTTTFRNITLPPPPKRVAGTDFGATAAAWNKQADLMDPNRRHRNLGNAVNDPFNRRRRY